MRHAVLLSNDGIEVHRVELPTRAEVLMHRGVAYVRNETQPDPRRRIFYRPAMVVEVGT